MADYIRARQQGGTYFFTVVTNQRQPIFTDPVVRAALRESIVEARLKVPFQIDAWVLLPDHLHCIWTLPESDHDSSTRWGLIKAGCSRRLAHAESSVARTLSRQQRRESSLWQRRFWEHLVRGHTDLRNHLDYLHYNPVKHGLVQRPVDWAYSSFHRYLKAGFYEPGWAEGEKIDGDFGE